MLGSHWWMKLEPASMLMLEHLNLLTYAYGMSTIETNEAERVITDARKAWGDEYTKAIFGRLIASIDHANSSIRPIEPVNSLKIQIADMPLTRRGIKTARLWGWHSRWSGFDLLMDSKNPQAVLDETEVTVFHETARVRIFQQRITDGHYKDNAERDMLDVIVEDGMVISTVEEFLGRDAYDLEKYTSYGIPADNLLGYIASYLNAQDPSGLSDAEHLDIHMGSKELPRLGYRVGHAIVKSAMATYDLSAGEMLLQSPKFFSDHAKKLILE